jgi:hypothetical protein
VAVIGNAADLGQRVRETLEHLREEKDQAVRRDGPDAGLHPRIVVWRAGKLVALVHMDPADVSGPRLRQLASAVVRGLRADVVTVSYEGWGQRGRHSKDSMVNPDTGQPWEPGAMSDYVRAHGRDGTVSDCLMVHGVSLAADVAGSQIGVPRQGGFGWSIDWEDPWFDDAGGVHSGAMVETFREAMADVPRMNAGLAAVAMETEMTDPEEAEAIADALVVREVVGRRMALVMLTAGDDQPVRRATLSRMLGATPPEDLEQASRWGTWN